MSLDGTAFTYYMKEFEFREELLDLVQWQMQSIHGLAIHSPESNKSSRWSLMDFVSPGIMVNSLGCICTVLNPPTSSKTRGWILMDLGLLGLTMQGYCDNMYTFSVQASSWNLEI